MSLLTNVVYPFSLILPFVVALAQLHQLPKLPGRSWLKWSAIVVIACRTSRLAIGWLATLLAPNWHKARSLTESSVPSWHTLITQLELLAVAGILIYVFTLWARSNGRCSPRELFFGFSGRITRAEFWCGISIGLFLGIPFSMHSLAAFYGEYSGFPRGLIIALGVLWAFVGAWSSLAIYAKRWHDCSRSGWSSVVLLIPVIGIAVLVLYLGGKAGSPASNQWGDPANPAAGA